MLMASKPFHLWTWVGNNKSYSAALGQRVPGRISCGIVGYSSTPIPASMAGQHHCLLICDCAEWAVKITEEVVANQKVVVHTGHQILKLLTNRPRLNLFSETGHVGSHSFEQKCGDQIDLTAFN